MLPVALIAILSILLLINENLIPSSLRPPLLQSLSDTTHQLFPNPLSPYMINYGLFGSFIIMLIHKLESWYQKEPEIAIEYHDMAKNFPRTKQTAFLCFYSGFFIMGFGACASLSPPPNPMLVWPIWLTQGLFEIHHLCKTCYSKSYYAGTFTGLVFVVWMFLVSWPAYLENSDLSMIERYLGNGGYNYGSYKFKLLALPRDWWIRKVIEVDILENLNINYLTIGIQSMIDHKYFLAHVFYITLLILMAIFNYNNVEHDDIRFHASYRKSNISDKSRDSVKSNVTSQTNTITIAVTGAYGKISLSVLNKYCEKYQYVNIALMGRNQEKLEETKRDLIEKFNMKSLDLSTDTVGNPNEGPTTFTTNGTNGIEILLHQGSVNSTSDVDSFFEKTIDQFGYIDHILCNAGIDKGNDLDIADCNIMGTIRTVEGFKKSHMQKKNLNLNLKKPQNDNQCPHIILFGSMGGWGAPLPTKAGSMYGITKKFLTDYAMKLRIEEYKRGIPAFTISLLYIGFVREKSNLVTYSYVESGDEIFRAIHKRRNGTVVVSKWLLVIGSVLHDWVVPRWVLERIYRFVPDEE